MAASQAGQIQKRTNRNLYLFRQIRRHHPARIAKHDHPALLAYTASDNVGNAVNSFQPRHQQCKYSADLISIPLHNAVEPEETRIRLYENIANGSGLDMSMMGDMRGYEDERTLSGFQKGLRVSQKNEPYFGKYRSVAKIAVIAPGAWPNGEPMQEYRGIQLMLQEAHIPFDIVEDGQIANPGTKSKRLRTHHSA